MEYWEVLDGEGKSTGEIMEKYDKKVFERGFYHLGADVWIINSDNKILIQKRSSLKRLEPNVWAMTGGSVIVGENSLETIVREAKEELNIDIEKIAQYFQTPFGQEIIEHQADLEKEVLFSLMMEARDVFTGMETVDDPILIHGIIDGYFKREEGIVLFDYKTDHVAHLGKQAEKELVRRYRGQLILYKQALESIIKRPVIETNIISLDLTKTISVHP